MVTDTQAEQAPPPACTLKTEILAKYREQAVLDHGDLVLRIPIAMGQPLDALMEVISQRARRLSDEIDEPIACRRGRSEHGVQYVEVVTLGPINKVLHGMAAAAFELGARLATQPQLWWPGPKQWPRVPLTETASEGQGADPETDPLDDEGPLDELPEGYAEMRAGETVTSSCLMFTDAGWQGVAAFHVGRTVEMGERYARPAE